MVWLCFKNKYLVRQVKTLDLKSYIKVNEPKNKYTGIRLYNSECGDPTQRALPLCAAPAPVLSPDSGSGAAQVHTVSVF